MQFRQEKIPPVTPAQFKGESVIKTLDLSNRARVSAQKLGAALKNNETLTELVLADCSITTDGASALGQVLQNNSTLVKLDLSNNAIEDTTALCNALHNNTTLKELNLAYNQIGSNGVYGFDPMLRVNKALTSIDLSHNRNIGERGCFMIGAALREINTLEELKLSGCSSGPGGGASLAIGLTKSSVTSIDLTGNSLCKDGNMEAIHAICSMLRDNKVLTTMVLSVNDLGDAGAIALGEALKNNKTLKELALADCSIGEAGGTALAEALKVNMALTKLNVLGNPNLGDEAKAALRHAVSGRSGFQLQC